MVSFVYTTLTGIRCAVIRFLKNCRFTRAGKTIKLNRLALADASMLTRRSPSPLELTMDGG